MNLAAKLQKKQKTNEKRDFEKKYIHLVQALRYGSPFQVGYLGYLFSALPHSFLIPLRSYVIHHSHTEILRFFNARTRALARQWKLTYVATRALNYYMRSSCALTLAIKNELKSRAAVSLGVIVDEREAGLIPRLEMTRIWVPEGYLSVRSYVHMKSCTSRALSQIRIRDQSFVSVKLGLHFLVNETRAVRLFPRGTDSG